MNKLHTLSALYFFYLQSLAAAPSAAQSWVLSDPALLEQAGITALYSDARTGLAAARISTLQQSILSREGHKLGRCGGYELLAQPVDAAGFRKFVTQIDARRSLDQKDAKRIRALSERTQVTEAMGKVSETKIKEWVDWLSAFSTRYHKGPTPNAHVEALQTKLNEELKNYPALNATTALIAHTATRQKTLMLRIPGSTKPDEIVGMGAHLDSVVVNFIGMPSAGRSPGSDDDASGSAALLEALPHILALAPFERSIEIFWYAGEEAGLLGSKEIAADYKQKAKKVAGVLQLDMTLYPGNGAGSIASMTDFTSPELRAMLTEFNRLYLNVNIIDDQCGYGCSDHASWYRSGFPTLMPTEATFKAMNTKIHTAGDTVNSGSDFAHAAIFTKIAIAFASHLGSP